MRVFLTKQSAYEAYIEEQERLLAERLAQPKWTDLYSEHTARLDEVP